MLLHAACPPGHQVLFAPYDWLVDDHNVYEPDLLVAPDRAFTDRFLPVPPRLAVEVLSPSHPGRDGALVETGVAKGDEPLAVEHPFPVTLVAADLVD